MSAMSGMSVAATAHEPPPLPSGFEQLYVDHYDFVWRCALRLGATPADVEDIVQETFMVALRRHDQTEFQRGGARPSTWLFAILRNVLRNHARGERRRRTRHEALAELEAERYPARTDADSRLGLRLLDEFLRELEPDRREVFVLAELEGLRGPEIARVLALNPNTVRSRLRAARQAFEARFTYEHEHLVEAAANEAAPQELRARGLVLLGLSLEPSADPGVLGKLGVWATPRGLVGVVLGSGLLLAVGLGLRAREPSEPQTEAVTALEPSPAPTTEPTRVAGVEPSPTTSEPAIVVPLGAPQAAPSPAKPRTREPGQTQLDSSAALERLTRARRALLDGDPAACLALVERGEAWPAALDARRVALEIGALCALDRPQRARARARAWLAANPDASTAVELRAVCWTDDNSPAADGHQGSNGPSAREER